MTEPGRDGVECYSGYTYAQEPRVVIWQGRRFPVTGIERRWQSPDGPAFCVETETGIPFELHYNKLERGWTIQPLTEVEQEKLVPTGEDKGKQGVKNTHLHRSDHVDKEVQEER
jgi:hypothetical protein